jgi:uncharacterized membrane protein YiaA
MGGRAGTGPAILVSVILVVVGVLLLTMDPSSSTRAFAGVVIGVGVLFGAVNLVIQRRGR